jgi:hypothetical protein
MSDRLRAIRLAPLLLLLLLAVAWLAPSVGWLRLASSNTTEADRMTQALDALPPRSTVVVGFDPDLGTYAEIRPTVRALLADLLYRQASLAIVSVTPEGRALALAELERLQRGMVNARRILDLGFVPGAEAALVRLTRAGLPIEADGALAGVLATDGLAGAQAIVVVGGNDLGPRAWVEQVLPRVPGLPLLAVAPTILLPELRPYLATGQVDALLGTPRDGAAYRATLDVERLDRFLEPREPSRTGVAVGLVVAIGVLLAALVRRGGRSDAARTPPGPRTEAA